MNTLKKWAKDAGLRAVKTAAQTAVALLGTDAAGLTHADWATVGITAALAGGVSVLHNLASLHLEEDDEPKEPAPPTPAAAAPPADPAAPVAPAAAPAVAAPAVDPAAPVAPHA